MAEEVNAAENVTTNLIYARVVVKGVYDDYDTFIAAHATGTEGDAYQAAHHLYVWDADTGKWVDAGLLTATEATQAASGVMSAADKTKLDGMAAGAEVNQNAFAKVKAGGVTVEADQTSDTLELVAGNAIAITPDAAIDKVTIAVNGNFLPADGNAVSATKATQDSRGQQIDSTYIKSFSVSGRTVTYTRGNETTGSFQTQDTNTTYTLASLGGAPKPKTAAGLGQWTRVHTSDKTLQLPSGGTWAYFVIAVSNTAVGVAAGGSYVRFDEGGCSGLAWRIA